MCTVSAVCHSATSWTVACQAPLSMGFSRQEYWRGLPFPPPRDLPNPTTFNLSSFPKGNGFLPPPSLPVRLPLSRILSTIQKLLSILHDPRPPPSQVFSGHPKKGCCLYSQVDTLELDCQDSDPDYSLISILYGLSFHPCLVGISHY